jgi:tetratricopeptide (TPR) repeat protein
MAWRPYLTRVLADGDYDHVMTLAASAQQMGRTADVDRALGKATELAADDRSRLVEILQLAVDLGQTERAAVLLPVVTTGDPDPALERLAMELALAQGNPGEAADHLQRAIDSDPNPAPLAMVRNDFATLIALRGRVAQLAVGTAKDDAIAQVLSASRRWREIDPANATIDGLVGELLLNLDRPEEGLRQLSTAIERDPLDGAGWIKVADTLERHGRYDQALAMWQEALVIDQTNPGPRLRKAQAAALRDGARPRGRRDREGRRVAHVARPVLERLVPAPAARGAAQAGQGQDPEVTVM